jgi:transcriptional regulator with XRE-family HTH domain
MKNIFYVSGEALRNARKAQKGLTQKDVADEIGISRETYTGWEAKASIEVDKETLEKLINVLKSTEDVITNVPRDTLEGDILDHPVIKSLVSQSKYILKRVEDLERENKDLRDRLGGSGA